MNCTVDLPSVPYFGTQLDASGARCGTGAPSCAEATRRISLAGYTHVQQTSSSDTHMTLVAQSQATKEWVHIRVYALEPLRRDVSLRDRVERSVLVGRRVKHPCIVRVVGTFYSRTDLFVVEEYCPGGELLSWVETHCREATTSGEECGRPVGLSTGFVKSVMRDVVSGMNYLHTECGVAHRGIKLENVLLNADNRAKLSNLGTCAVIPADVNTDGTGGLLELCCASRHYAAPEVVMGQAYSGQLADVWAAGVLLFVLLTCRFPFEEVDGSQGSDGSGCNDGALLRRICEADEVLASHPALVRVPDPLAVDLVRNMLRVSTKARLTVEEVLQHPFLSLP
uniref:Putative serine/threonine-protein kinase n=1 Tax=Trypanosoma congolense (strain IL3000) TaxID=1068625 RepID=G0UVJ2_TRYCI|nr:putative serine/threonine-protein kinase [Trypanosoma congolense IL3000]